MCPVGKGKPLTGVVNSSAMSQQPQDTSRRSPEVPVSFAQGDIDAWKRAAAKSAPKGDLDALTWHTPDGIAVKLPGSLTVPVICDYVDEIVQVEEEEIALAIVSLLEKTKLLVEGAGAVTLAAIQNRRIPEIEGKTVCLLSGGNIDVKTISQVVERGLIAGGRYLKLTIELDDHPGALATLTKNIAATRANIFHISHDRRSKTLAIGRTDVSLELETRATNIFGK